MFVVGGYPPGFRKPESGLLYSMYTIVGLQDYYNICYRYKPGLQDYQSPLIEYLRRGYGGQGYGSGMDNGYYGMDNICDIWYSI